MSEHAGRRSTPESVVAKEDSGAHPLEANAWDSHEDLFNQIRRHWVFAVVFGGLVVLTLFVASASHDSRQNERLRLELADQRARLALAKRQSVEGAKRLTDQIIDLQEKLRATERDLLRNQRALREALGSDEDPKGKPPALDTTPASPEVAAQLQKAIREAAAAISQLQGDIRGNERAYLEAARGLAADQMALYSLQESVVTLRHNPVAAAVGSKSIDDFMPVLARQVERELAEGKTLAECRPPSNWPTGLENLTDLARHYARVQGEQQKRLKSLQDELIATQAAITAAQRAISAARSAEADALNKAAAK